MTTKTPPKTRAKLDPVAQTQLGKTRTCDTCGEDREISHSTFAPSKRPGKSILGWSTTCRKCHATAGAKRKAASKERHKRLQEDQADDELIARMYAIQDNLDCHDELVAIKEELHARIMGPLELNDELKSIDSGVPTRETLKQRKASFKLFVKVLKPLIAGWVDPGEIHDDIDAGLLSTAPKVAIIATRYSAKSTRISIYVTWRLYRNPLMKIMVLAGVTGLAKRMLKWVRTDFIGNCPLLSHMRPDTNPKCIDAAEKFTIPATVGVNIGGYSFSCFGIDSSVVGNRADETVLDDIETEDHNTPDKVAELTERMNEVTMINPRGRKTLAGTYQSEYSYYASLSLDDTWEVHRAIMFADPIYDDRDNLVSVRSRWPAKFPEDAILKWRRDVTLRGWKLHVALECDPEILSERPLKISSLIVSDVNPRSEVHPLYLKPGGDKITDLRTWGAPSGDHWYGPAEIEGKPTPYITTVGFVDPAGGLIGRGDAIGLAILSATQGGQVVIRHLEGIRVRDRDLRWPTVARRMRDFNVDAGGVEENINGEVARTLEDECASIGHPMTFEQVTTGKASKGERIISLAAPPMDQGRVVILRDLIETDHGGEFVNQLVKIQYDNKHKGHDDIADAYAHALGMLRDHLVTDRIQGVAHGMAMDPSELYDVPLRAGGIEEGDLLDDLLQEDEFLQKLQRKLDNFIDIQRKDKRMGRPQDPQLTQRIIATNRQIKELKHAHAQLLAP